MKTLVKLFALLSVVLLSFSSVFAIDAPINVVSTNTTSDSISLSWDVVDWALYYNVYYGEEPGIDILTANSLSYEPENSIELTDLESGKNYYFLFSSIDEQWDESALTQEYVFSTTWNEEMTSNDNSSDMNSAADFQLSYIEVLYQNQVAVTFNAPLENNADTEMIFSVTELEDELKEYTVSGSIVDPQDSNTAIITFNENLPLEVDYKLVVISAFDQNGRNIESWIESYENFYVDASVLEQPENNQEPVDPLVDPIDSVVEEPVVEEHAQLEEQNNQITDNQTTDNQNTDTTTDFNAADNQESEPIQDVAWAASEVDALPQTWPTHILMLLLALALGTMTFVFRSKN